MICECAPENLQKTAGIFNAKITTLANLRCQFF